MPGGNEGPNWILLAGGAAVTALSYLIRRRQKHEFEDKVEEREGKSGKVQPANYNDGFEPDYWGTETSEACPHQDSVESVASSSLTDSMRSGLPIAPALSRGTSTGGLADALLANNHHDRKQIPLSVEFSEEEKSFQRRVTFSQEDVRRSNQQGVQIGRTAKRDMVHRLRKQLKSRDEMILRMQVQISENERSLSLSDAHVSELQGRLEATSRVLSDLDKGVQLFRNQLADFVKFDAKIENCNESAAGGAESATSCGGERRDMNLTLLELTKLGEVLDQLKEETTAREIERQALLQEYNSMIEKVGHLECALKEQRMLVSEKEQVLNMTQEELLGVTSRLQAQIEDTESLRHSKAKLEACIHNLNSRGLSLRDLHNSEEIISSTSTEVSDSSSHLPQGRGNPDLLDTGHEFKMDLPENINDPAAIDSVVVALQQEVEQLSTALVSKVTEQKEQTTRLVKDLQVEGTKDTMLLILDSVPETLKSKDSEWLHLSQQLSSSTSLATPAQVNELNINLVELAKCKQVEEEMVDIRKYQAKIAELRQNNSNLTQDSIDEVHNEQSLHVAALICGLAEKLAAQEERAKQTALEVQQLSTSFQLLTPIVAKLQDKNTALPLAGQPNSAKMVSHDVGHIKFDSLSVHPKHAAQGSNISWAGTPEPGRQDSDASDSSAHSSNQISPDYMLSELADDDYHFRVGASGPLATKIRRFSSKWDGKNGRRKKPFTHDYGSGSDSDIIPSGNWATKSGCDKDLYRQERVNANVPQYRQNSLGSFVEFQDSESRSIPVEDEKNGHNTWAVQQKGTYSPFEVEQVMAAGTPDPAAVDFVPTLEEFSPPVRQVRSPRQGIESSRRYLFNAGSNQGDHTNSLNGYSVTAAESSLGEESASERSFSVERIEASSISPFSKIMAQLDYIEELPETSSLQEASVELLLPDSPQDVVEDETRSLEEDNTSSADRSIVTRDIDESEANTSTTNRLIVSEDVDESEAKAPVADGLIATPDIIDSVSESGSEERDSIDSEFDEMLDGTLDDLVKIFSTTVTPASTPRSSVMSQNSGSKKFQ